MTSARWPTVLFDLDGTLANTIPLILASYEHATRLVLGSVPTEQTMRGWIGRTLWDSFSELAPDHVDDLVEAYTVWNLANLTRLVRPYAGAAELLDALGEAGVRTGVVTSKRRPAAEATLAAVGLAGRVPVLASAFDTVHHKPHPEPLLFGLRALGSAPADGVYVGDAIVDLQAAVAAGMGSIAVTWGAASRQELDAQRPTALCDTMEELRRVLVG